MLCLTTTWLLKHHAYLHLPPPAHSLPMCILLGAHLMACKRILHSHLLGCHDKSFSGTEEGWQHGRAGPGLTGIGCVSTPWGGEKAGPGRPGARVQPTCFLTPVLLPVNPAALQPEWPDRMWVWLPSCFVLHQAGSPALHNCSLPVAASYTQAQSWSC